jgi:hypothetical protein
MPRFDALGPLPHDPDLTRLYDMVPGETPLEALYRVHADGLGPGRVRLVNGRLEFAEAADQVLCAGLWRVECCQNGHARRVELIIPPPDASRAGDMAQQGGAQGDGAHAAAVRRSARLRKCGRRPSIALLPVLPRPAIERPRRVL